LPRNLSEKRLQKVSLRFSEPDRLEREIAATGAKIRKLVYRVCSEAAQGLPPGSSADGGPSFKQPQSSKGMRPALVSTCYFAASSIILRRVSSTSWATS